MEIHMSTISMLMQIYASTKDFLHPMEDELQQKIASRCL